MSPRDTDNVQRAFASAREAITVRRFFGEAYERNGITVIPAARVAGGGGGSSAPGENGDSDYISGSAGGFGVKARPAGVYVIDGQNVRWRPAVDVNQIAFAFMLLVALALLVWRSVAGIRDGTLPE